MERSKETDNRTLAPFPIIFRQPAIADIQSAFDWYEDKQRGLGVRFLNELGKTKQLISANPMLFAPIYKQVRRAILHRFPYAVFYIVRPEFASVIAVLHHARHPNAWQQRSN